MMRKITVYRVDYAQKSKVPIGWIQERRKKERGDNLIGLMRLARKSFSASPEVALHIAVDGKEAGRTSESIPMGRIVPSRMTL